jgi:4-hydroxy-3-polyprenylbenzoate decarboxylase
LSRAADVCLKERRRVVLLFREAPLHAGHIRSMAAATENGAIVFPPVPAFYDQPRSLDDMVDHTVGRVLDLYDVDAGLVRRWSGRPPEHAEAASRSATSHPHTTKEITPCR